jgi:hypothetical protein
MMSYRQEVLMTLQLLRAKQWPPEKEGASDTAGVAAA